MNTTPTTDWDFPIQSSREAIEYVRRESGRTIILSYSTGKDSLAAWAALRPYFPRIIPIYHYLVPDLEHVETYLAYVEDKLNTRILRLPHPFLTWTLRHGALQDPVRAAYLQALDYPTSSYEFFADRVRERYDAPDAWIAVGTTQNDSVNRRLTFRKEGMARPAQRKLFPIGDWTKGDIIGAIKAFGVKLPPDYHTWGRSLDGTDWFFLEGLRRHWPRDYERVLDLYPLAHLEHRRVQIATHHQEANRG